MISRDFIKKAALEAGFSLCGIAPCRRLEEQHGWLGLWLGKGYDSNLEYMRRNVDKRSDPAALLDNARTVIVCAVNYKNGAWNQSAAKTGCKVASYAYAVDYHITIKKMLHEILESVKAEYPATNGKCFTDTALLLEKAWAAEAGLGWVGKNSLLVTPDYGSFVLLGEIIIDVEVDGYDKPLETQGCGECRRCMDSCPNGAICSPRVIDATSCISRLTIERMPEGGVVDKKILHGWIFGCDECQSCCPFNFYSPGYSNPAFAPVMDPAEATPEFWENLTEQKFDKIFGNTPLGRAGFRKIKGNSNNL